MKDRRKLEGEKEGPWTNKRLILTFSLSTPPQERLSGGDECHTQMEYAESALYFSHYLISTYNKKHLKL